MIELRDYQRAAVDALYAYWEEGGGNPLIVLPTGAGKSLVIATIAQELLRKWPRLRIGVATHRKELISQNFMELLRLWPQAPAGIYSAGIGRYDIHAQILFCGVQSIFRRMDSMHGFDVLIVDESHTIPRSSSTMYGKFIEGLKDKVPDMRIVGLTATPYRLDSGRLDEGDDALFDCVVYEAQIPDMIEAGWLSPLISKASATEIDVSSVARRGGEFVPGSLEAASMRGGLVDAAAADIVRRAGDRRSWLAFCAGVAHAIAMRDALRGHGVIAEIVNGQMASGERDSIIARFRAGQIHCLTSVDVLSIGFNVPQVDLIALLRPTLSTGLYIQQVGRGFRTALGKNDCLVLDFAGNVRRHGPVDAVTPPERKAKNGEAKVGVDTIAAKACPVCETLVGIAARTCWVCGHIWEIESNPKHAAEADDVPIMSTELKNRAEIIPVVSWSAGRHQKLGSPDSLKVNYYAGLQSYSEWIHFNQKGFLRDRAERWWVRHNGGRIPADVTEALARFDQITMPDTISVRRNGKFFDVVARTFATQKTEAA